MTTTLNLGGPDPDPAGKGSETDAHDVALYGAIAADVPVGRYVVTLGDPSGARLRDASSAGPGRYRPRPTPVLLRPSLMRGLVGRQAEIDAALAALDAGLPFEVSGEPGLGKTALLRHLAHHPRASVFPDGVVYLSARQQPTGDLLQRLFEAFYESDEIGQPTQAEIRRGLRDKEALLLLDEVDRSQYELEQVLESAPRASVVVASRQRCLWSEARCVTLDGLQGEDALRLIEQASERALDAVERPAAAAVCAALGGRPLRLLQAAARIRDEAMSPGEWGRDMNPESIVGSLLQSLDQKQRRVALAMTALPGVPLQAQHIAGIAEIADVDLAVITLLRRALVVRSGSRYCLADLVTDRLRRTDDLKPWVNRAITYFTAWAERHRRSAETLHEESDALLAVQQQALEARRWGEVVRLGRLLEGALVVGARWGAWATTLERCLAAAKALGDRSLEAWVLHELGTRAVCVAEPGRSRALLRQAVTLRETLGEETAAEVSRQNLGFVLTPVIEPVPVIDPGPEPAAILFDATPDFATQRRVGPAPPMLRAAKRTSLGAMSLTLLLSTMGGWFGYSALAAALADPRSSLVRAGLAGPTINASASPVAVAAPPLPSPASESTTLATSVELDASASAANILIFTARPGSIVTAQSTQLCYAVSGAAAARIEPGIGDVDATSTLTCRRVTPRRTTTYELTAYDEDGRAESQRLVLVVR